MADNTEQPENLLTASVEVHEANDEEQFDSCSSDVENVGQRSAGASCSSMSETTSCTTSSAETSRSLGSQCEMEENEYMPPEPMVSDDSDTAGLYTVNNTSEENHSSSPKRPKYQRVPAPVEYGSSEYDSDDDPSELLIQANKTLSSSENDGDSSNDGESYLNTGDVKIKSNLMSGLSMRQYGNFGMKPCLSNYVPQMMSNSSFVSRLQCVTKLDEHEGCVNALNFNQSGNWLASGSDDLKAIIWDMNTYKPYFSFDTGHRSNVFQTKFMPFSNDTQLVTCARDGQVRLCELSSTGSCRGSKKVASHKGSAHKLAVEFDDPHCLLSAGEDGVVFQIDLRQPNPIKLALVRNERQKLPLHSIDRHPYHSHEFLVSGKDHFIRIFDKRKLTDETDSDGIVKKFYPHKFESSSPYKRDVTCAVYNYNGSEIIGTYNDDDIYLFDNDHSDNTDASKVYTGHRNSATVKGVNFFGPKSEYVVSGSDCGNVYLWDKESTKVLQIQKGDEGGVVNVLEPHPFFPYLAVSGLDNDVKLFMPVAEAPVDLKSKAKLMKDNVDARGLHHAEEIDGQLLWLIMQQLRRARRRREQAAGAGPEALDSDLSSSSNENDSDSDSDDGDYSSREILANASCVTS